PISSLFSTPPPPPRPTLSPYTTRFRSLHLPRSPDPLLKAVADRALAIDFGSAATAHGGVARGLARHRSVTIGGAILALVVVVAVLAPWLGTRDPAQIDPGFRNRRPGAER